MRAGELLDSDLAVLGPRLAAAVRTGLAWWLGELRAMVPAALRQGGGASMRLAAERQDGGGYILHDRDGRTRVHRSGGTPIPVALRLPPAIALLRHVPAPALAERDLRRMVALDVDRLTPFDAEEVYLDLAVRPVGEAGGGRRVLLGVMLRSVADEAAAHALAAGLRPAALSVDAGDGTVLDFAPAMRAAGALDRRGHAAGWWWSAVAALVALNVACWVWRDVHDLADLQASVAAQRPQVERVAALRRSVLAETARRHALATALQADAPLRALDAASRALPDGVWVQRASFTASAVRLAGRRPPGLDVVAALRREPVFRNVEGAATDAGAASGSSTDGDPFDVSADLAPASGGPP